MRDTGPPRPTPPAGRTRIWDLPTRLTHWALALLVATSIITAKLGGLWLDWHFRSGYAILALLLFRLLWGFAGSRYALFSTFVRGPKAVLDYLRGRPVHVAGHNPLGALAVLAMLAVLLTQAVSGLFTSDGSFTEGPLAGLAGGEWVSWMSTVHGYGEWIVYGLIGLHIAAILFYALVKRDRLLKPMLLGDRDDVTAEPADDGGAMRLRALVLALLAVALVAYVVTL